MNLFGLIFWKSPPNRQNLGALNGVPQDSKRKGVAYEILQKSTIFEDFEGFADGWFSMIFSQAKVK